MLFTLTTETNNMSYKTFEINNGVLTVKDAMYKGIAACKNNNLKTFEPATDIDVYLDSDNWGESDTPILDDMAESFGDMWV